MSEGVQLNSSIASSLMSIRSNLEQHKIEIDNVNMSLKVSSLICCSISIANKYSFYFVDFVVIIVYFFFLFFFFFFFFFSKLIQVLLPELRSRIAVFRAEVEEYRLMLSPYQLPACNLSLPCAEHELYIDALLNNASDIVK